MKYTKNEIATAYHESGHAVAMLLVGEKFKSVSITQDNKGDYTRGLVKREFPIDEGRWKTMSFFNLNDNVEYFKFSFLMVSGFVSEWIYRGRVNNHGAKSDFIIWIKIVLLNLPVHIRKPYQRFLIDYTKEVLSRPSNWLIIKSTAEALLKQKSLTYQEFEIIKKYV